VFKDWRTRPTDREAVKEARGRALERPDDSIFEEGRTIGVFEKGAIASKR
jgi:hypothetical protein